VHQSGTQVKPLFRTSPSGRIWGKDEE
jgi:hypothetical protein